MVSIIVSRSTCTKAKGLFQETTKRFVQSAFRLNRLSMSIWLRRKPCQYESDKCIYFYEYPNSNYHRYANEDRAGSHDTQRWEAQGPIRDGFIIPRILRVRISIFFFLKFTKIWVAEKKGSCRKVAYCYNTHNDYSWKSVKISHVCVISDSDCYAYKQHTPNDGDP